MVIGEPSWNLLDLVDRRGLRRRVSLAANLWRGEQQATRLRLHNLSRFGFMGEGTGRVEIGEMLTLAVDGERIAPAEVHIVWALAGRVGGEFVRPLDLVAVERMIGQSRSDA